MEIEVEVKKESALENPCADCICGNQAMMTVEIGSVYSSLGTEYDLCGNKNCVDAALKHELENLEERWINRREIGAAERYDMREGK